MSNCTHQQFKADVAVNRFEDTGGFMADVRIHCIDCGKAFRFMGLRAGVNFHSPTVSIDETELHAPIEPEDEKRLQTSASFQMPEIMRKN